MSADAGGFWFEFVPDDSEPDFIDDQSWSPVPGKNFEAVKSRTFAKLDKVSSSPAAVKETWAEEVIRVTSKCLPPETKGEQRAQLVFGRVQAGKTSNFTGVISLLADSGYDLFIVVAGINLNLRDQTFDRLKKDLGVASDPGFEVHASDPRTDVAGAANHIIDRLRQIKEPAGHFGSKFKKRLVYVVLKEITHLTWINSVLRHVNQNHQAANVLLNASTLVIDDETDQASPDTYEKRDDQTGAIHEALASLRANLPTHTYAGYTATPYANLLMAETNRLKCTSLSVLDAGPDYVGPETLFLNPAVHYASELSDWSPNRNQMPESLIKAFATFLVQAAAMNAPDEMRSSVTTGPFSANMQNEIVPCSMLVHASQRVNEAQQVFDEMSKLKNSWVKALNTPLGPNQSRDKSYNDLWGKYLSPACVEVMGPTYEANAIFREIVESVVKLSIIRQINGPGKAQGFDFPSEEDFEKSPAWVLIGGQLLDRGQTLPHLVNTYMPRPPAGSKGNPVRGQLDTMQQRGRFYGQRMQYLPILRGWFESSALETYKSIARIEPRNIGILKRHEESGLSLSKLHLVFELEGDLKLARGNVLPADVFEMKSAKWLFRQTHFDSAKQSDGNLEQLKKLLAKLGNPALLGELNPIGRQNVSFDLTTEQAKEFIAEWNFSEQEDKTKAVATDLLSTYFANGMKGVKLILMSRRPDDPKNLDTFGEYRSATDHTYVRRDGTVLHTTKITGLTSSNDAKFISSEIPSIQVHVFDSKQSGIAPHHEVGLAIAFPNTTRVTGRKASIA